MVSPDFLKIADAYGIDAYKITWFEDMEKYSADIYSKKWPALIWYTIEKEENVYPMVPAGKCLGDVIVGE
jgi:acetolactate synthase-1/2/3 large subunit